LLLDITILSHIVAIVNYWQAIAKVQRHAFARLDLRKSHANAASSIIAMHSPMPIFAAHPCGSSSRTDPPAARRME